MALSTTDHHADAPKQSPTPNVGRQGKAPDPAAEAAPAEPVLFDDIDPVLLVRLYPEVVNVPEARAKAMAAGTAAAEQSASVVASQNEPVVILGEEPPPPPPPPAAAPASAPRQPHKEA